MGKQRPKKTKVKRLPPQQHVPNRNIRFVFLFTNLYEFLVKEVKIPEKEIVLYYHDAIMGTEQSEIEHIFVKGGLHCRNLFLKDKKSLFHKLPKSSYHLHYFFCIFSTNQKISSWSLCKINNQSI